MLDQARSSQRYEARIADDEETLVSRMLELARRYPRYGYRRIAAKLRQEGWSVNTKRIYRLWRQEGLKVPLKKRKKSRLGDSKNSIIRRRSEGMDDVWCWDFIFDHTTNGTALKWLSIVDEFTRENLCLKVSRSIRSDDVLDTLSELFAVRGVPNQIRSDNGPEFVAKIVQQWLTRLDVRTLYIAPGSPWENGLAESFHSRVRDEFLALEEFESVAVARRLTDQWREDYNRCRPHSSLGYQTPCEYAARQTSARARQTGAAPSALTSASADLMVTAEATVMADGAPGYPLENQTCFTQPVLS